MQRWSVERACEWAENQPWFFGANFTPSTAINQLEMWQKESFDPESICRKMGYATDLGMTMMRVYLHDLLWEQDEDGFCKRIGQYLAIADNFEIKTMFIFFDDCWNQEFSLGRQPDPKPFTLAPAGCSRPG